MTPAQIHVLAGGHRRHDRTPAAADRPQEGTPADLLKLASMAG